MAIILVLFALCLLAFCIAIGFVLFFGVGLTAFTALRKEVRKRVQQQDADSQNNSKTP